MRSRETVVRLHRFRRDEKRRQVADIEAMIADLNRKYDDLDQQMRLEEQRTGVTDPTHFNYSMSAKASRVRRDNLLKSIGELKDQFVTVQSALAEEETELRKVELLAEKEAGAHGQTHIAPPGTPAHAYSR